MLDCELDYDEILRVFRERDRSKFLYTIEFFPEEGKYHFDGHRACQLRLSPQETRAAGGRCPSCGRPITVGVMSRVEALADRPTGEATGRVPFRNLIPLEEIIAEALGAQPGTGAVREEYFRLVHELGSEFAVLLDAPPADVARYAHPRVVDGLRRVREGRVVIHPGYDGVFGEIHIFQGADDQPRVEEPAQTSLF